MSMLEQDLRDELARRLAAAPPLPHLTDTALRRGRAARRRRRALLAAAGASVVALGLGATSLVPSLPDLRRDVAAAALEGPPRVPMYLGQGKATLLDWPGGAERARSLDDGVLPVAQVPAGLLVVMGGPAPALGLLEASGAEPRALVAGLVGHSVAVSDDGQRATVVVLLGRGHRLQEVELPSGRALRSVALAAPAFGVDEPVQPVAYSGDAVLVNTGEGSRQRARLWERGDDGVVGDVDGVRAALDGADAGWSDDRDAVGGRAAFAVAGGRCGTEVHELRNGDGNPWALCGEGFVGFSPDGRAVLATDATLRALVVHDADGGDVLRTFEVPGGVRASGWESDDTVLYTTVDAARTLVVRCSVDRGACATATELPFTDRIPQPVDRS